MAPDWLREVAAGSRAPARRRFANFVCPRLATVAQTMLMPRLVLAARTFVGRERLAEIVGRLLWRDAHRPGAHQRRSRRIKRVNRIEMGDAVSTFEYSWGRWWHTDKVVNRRRKAKPAPKWPRKQEASIWSMSHKFSRLRLELAEHDRTKLSRVCQEIRIPPMRCTPFPVLPKLFYLSLSLSF